MNIVDMLFVYGLIENSFIVDKIKLVTDLNFIVDYVGIHSQTVVLPLINHVKDIRNNHLGLILFIGVHFYDVKKKDVLVMEDD